MALRNSRSAADDRERRHIGVNFEDVGIRIDDVVEQSRLVVDLPDQHGVAREVVDEDSLADDNGGLGLVNVREGRDGELATDEAQREPGTSSVVGEPE